MTRSGQWPSVFWSTLYDVNACAIFPNLFQQSLDTQQRYISFNLVARQVGLLIVGCDQYH